MGHNYISSVQFHLPKNDKGDLGSLPAWHHLPMVRQFAETGLLSFDKPVTFFVGENGTGKSTLLEAIAVAAGFNPEGGTRNFHFSTRATHSDLHQYITLSRSAHPKDGFFFRAESFYNAATYIDELDALPAAAPPISVSYGGKSLHHQSHGESFLSLVENRFGGFGLYLLDEPESALSPTGLMRLLIQLRRLEEQKSQFLIATHSPILMAYPGAQVLLLSEEGIHPVDYRETDHYRLTRRFLEHPEEISRLLSPT
jgi:predicted ATPase